MTELICLHEITKLPGELLRLIGSYVRHYHCSEMANGTGTEMIDYFGYDNKTIRVSYHSDGYKFRIYNMYLPDANMLDEIDGTPECYILNNKIYLYDVTTPVRTCDCTHIYKASYDSHELYIIRHDTRDDPDPGFVTIAIVCENTVVYIKTYSGMCGSCGIVLTNKRIYTLQYGDELAVAMYTY